MGKKIVALYLQRLMNKSSIEQANNDIITTNRTTEQLL
jgi:hypothetical protein